MATFFKEPPVSAKVRRRRKHQDRQSVEQDQMQAVRRRDKYCRFPLCGCGKFRLQLEVSHREHRGMGGDLTGERSHPDLLLLLCSARHRENIVAIDRGSLRWLEIGRDAADDPLIAWEVDRHAIEPHYLARSDEPVWMELARETALHVFEPFTHEQLAILRTLAEMET